MKRGSGLALWILLTALVCGCAGGLYSDGYRTYLDANGDVVRTYPADYDKTVRAGTATLEDLYAVVLNQHLDRSETLVEARTPDGSPLRLHYIREGRNLTVVRVRTGRFGYPGREYSNQFHAYLDAKLKRRAKRPVKQAKTKPPETDPKTDKATIPAATAIMRPKAEASDEVAQLDQAEPPKERAPQPTTTLETASATETAEPIDPPEIFDDASSDETEANSLFAEDGNNTPTAETNVDNAPIENRGNGPTPETVMDVPPTEADSKAQKTEEADQLIEKAIVATSDQTGEKSLIVKTENDPAIIPEIEQIPNRQKPDYIIFFSKDSNIPMPEALNVLDEAAQQMRSNPDVAVELNGYADTDEDPEEFQLVSESRSQAVKSYLIGKGIEPHRIHTAWHGSHFSTQSEDNSQNRRVEIRLTRGL